MSILLHLETSADFCSVALSENERLLDFVESNEKNSHAQSLLIYIDSLLQKNAISKSELKAVSISSGPGSYTGLRIGTSTAKAICSALHIPLIAVSTLLALAYAAREEDAKAKYYVPLIDARRMEAYAAVFDNALKIIQEESAIDFAASPFKFPEKSMFCGNASLKLKDKIESNRGLIAETVQFSAKNQVALAYQKYLDQEFCDLAYFEPNYIKNFQLTIKKK